MKWIFLLLITSPFLRDCHHGRIATSFETKTNSGIAEVADEAMTKESDKRNLGETVRVALDRQCGSCHNSSNQTAKAAALDIFDCKEENWPQHHLAEHISGLQNRTLKSRSFSEEEKEAIRLLITDLQK